MNKKTALDQQMVIAPSGAKKQRNAYTFGIFKVRPDTLKQHTRLLMEKPTKENCSPAVSGEWQDTSTM